MIWKSSFGNFGQKKTLSLFRIFCSYWLIVCKDKKYEGAGVCIPLALQVCCVVFNDCCALGAKKVEVVGRDSGRLYNRS